MNEVYMEGDIGVIYNATDETVETKALGRYFSFPANKIKLMNPSVATWIGQHRVDLGLIALPTQMADPEFRATPEGKRILAEKKKEGVHNFVSHLRNIADNLKSLQKDYDQANLKIDARADAVGEYDALMKLAAYQAKGADENQKRVDKIKELEESLKKG